MQVATLQRRHFALLAFGASAFFSAHRMSAEADPLDASTKSESDDVEIEDADMYSNLMSLADSLHEQGYLVTSAIIANVAYAFEKAQDDTSTIFSVAEEMRKSGLLVPGKQIEACGLEHGSAETFADQQ